MRSLLVIHNTAALPDLKLPASREQPPPEFALRANGYIIRRTNLKDQAKTMIRDADAAVLHVPLDEIKDWGNHLLKLKPIPLLWWCGKLTSSLSLEACEDDVMIDGVLSPDMDGYALHWALHFSAKQFTERRQWQSEREQLLGRIEERKWIDMAKSILCEIKGITESEAYDMLRKQAMNERKRMVDVATSIVKVYQLLQEKKESGAKPR